MSFQNPDIGQLSSDLSSDAVVTAKDGEVLLIPTHDSPAEDAEGFHEDVLLDGVLHQESAVHEDVVAPENPLKDVPVEDLEGFENVGPLDALDNGEMGQDLPLVSPEEDLGKGDMPEGIHQDALGRELTQEGVRE